MNASELLSKKGCVRSKRGSAKSKKELNRLADLNKIGSPPSKLV